MAKIEAGLYRGTIGDKTYSIDPKTRKQIVRQYKSKVKNPRTPAQQSRRSNFGLISTLSSKMTEAHKIGLHIYAQRHKLYTYTAFRSLNSQCFTPEGEIDFPNLTLSSGNIAPITITSVHLDTPAANPQSENLPTDNLQSTNLPATNLQSDNLQSDNTYDPAATPTPTAIPTTDPPTTTATRLLHITYDPNLPLANASPDDQLFLFAYCHTLQAGRLFGPYPRPAASIVIPLPAEWPSAHTHLYAFFRGKRLQTSNTIYIPLP